MGAHEVSEALDRWTREGFISDEQRAAILAQERAVAAPQPGATSPVGTTGRRRIPAVAEALGYLGGILAVVGLGLIVGRYWPDMATASRLALSGAMVLVLLGAGALVREAADPALARLRWFLWLAATAGTVLFTRVAMVDGLDVAPETVMLACAGAVAVLSGLLWAGRDRPLQQLTFLGGVVVWVGAVIAELATGAPVGIGVWITGAVILVLGLRRVLLASLLVEGVGAVAVVVGSIITAADSGPGMLFMCATAFGLVAIATVPGLAPERDDRLLLGLVGGFTLLQATPSTLGWFSREAAGATGAATWVIGALLLYVGSRGRTLVPMQTQALGGIALLGGAALTWREWHGAAPLIGLATAVALVGLGTRPGQMLMSILGSVGLLINVPWAINWFFPGEGRAPLMIMVSGALIIGIAVLLNRMSGRIRHDLGSMRHRGPSGGGVAPGPVH